MSTLLGELNNLLKRYGSRIIYYREEDLGEPPPGANLEELDLDKRLIDVLKSKGITYLYKFQEEVLKCVQSNKNVVIVSGTGTGKTEAFMIPILDKLLRLRESGSKPYVLLLYPTKALARDQAIRIKALAEGGLGFRVEVLDGDTPKKKRSEIYSNPPHILITNPDMLHVGMAFSSSFRKLVSKARMVVLDEMHVYKGVFGSHVSWIMRRLKKLSLNKPLFIGAGATIGNPKELGEILFGEKVEVVQGPKRKGKALHVLIDQGRVSRWSLAAYLTSYFVKKNKKVLVFVDSQQMAELIARMTTKSYGIRIGVHRAGLLPEERRSVEEAFWRGDLLAVAATPTLELGIDIGDLDVVIMPHLPRSYASYIQRAGRVGRRKNRVGYVITILGDDPIEAYFASRPEEFFNQEIDPSYVEPFNREVAKVHILAMILEHGFLKTEDLPKEVINVVDELKAIGLIKKSKGIVLPDWRRAENFLKARSGLRSSGPQVKIFSEGKLIGYREMPLALYDLYPGAIYYHAGKSYISTKLDVEAYKAEVRSVGAELNMYTKPLYTVDLVSVIPIEKRKVGVLNLVYGDIKVLVVVEGYVIKEESSGTTISEIRYETPLKWSYWTKGVMTRYPDAGISSLTKLISGYHALEHVLISASKPIVGASDTDLGGISYPTGHIIIYDSAPGGHGASRLIFERFEKIEDMALKILGGCTCEDGCPRCVYSPYCGSGNKFLSRRSALKILSYTLQLREGVIPEKEIEGKPLA